ELATGRTNFDGATHMNLVVKVVGNMTGDSACAGTGFTLDADSIMPHAGSSRKTIVPHRGEAVHARNTNSQVLARKVRLERATVNRLEVKGGDAVALGFLTIDDKWLEAFPTMVFAMR